MRRSRKLLALFVVLSLMNLRMKCEPRYQINNQKLVASDSGEVRFIGDVTLVRRAPRTPPQLEMRYYSDPYQTMVLSLNQGIADNLDHIDSNVRFDILAQALGQNLATGGRYPLVCATFRMKHSNFPDWSQMGCVDTR